MRACREDDLEDVLWIWERSRSEHASTEDSREDLERLLGRFPGSLLLAEHRGATVGAVIAGWDGWRGNIYRLAILDDHRRRGIGRALVREAEARLRDRGCRRVTALVAHEGEPAGRFWEAVGYPEDHEIGRRVKNL